MGTGDIPLGGNLAMDLHLIQEGVAIFGGLLFATETENKLRLCAPLPLRMLCPGGTRSVFTRDFWAKRKLPCISLEKKCDHYSIQTRHNDPFFFSYCNLFQGKLKVELVRKTRVNSERAYRIVLMPPGHTIILLKSH